LSFSKGTRWKNTTPNKLRIFQKDILQGKGEEIKYLNLPPQLREAYYIKRGEKHLKECLT
jgi:hypothetical protein